MYIVCWETLAGKNQWIEIASEAALRKWTIKLLRDKIDQDTIFVFLKSESKVAITNA